MKWTTPVENEPLDWQIDFGDSILLLGSCFSDEIGARLIAHGYDAVCNPVGTLYNPLSIAQALCSSAQQAQDLKVVERDGLWHSMQHHTRFSDADKSSMQSKCLAANNVLRERFEHASVVIITFGSAYVYEYEGEVVANCHKLPEQQFVRRRLSVQQIVETWRPIIEQHPQIHWLFTVSPIRHVRDGLHANQISKSILLQAVELLTEQTAAAYFPSYEILLDELRDYRFYAEDLCHPSSVAADYIYERLEQACMSPATRQESLRRWKQYKQAAHHPIN